MKTCPNCQRQSPDDHNYCKHCGTRFTVQQQVVATSPSTQPSSASAAPLAVKEAPPPPEELEIKNMIAKRVQAIKDRDPGAIAATIDIGIYSKFDDWPPYQLLRTEALTMEADALKSLQTYDYYLTDFQGTLLGNTGVYTCLNSYTLTMRGQFYTITSRITFVLRKTDQGWKIVHEHWSRLPEQPQT